MTVDESIRSAAKYLAECGVESPRIDAELLMAKLLGIRRDSLVARGLSLLDEPSQLTFNRWIARRGENREPLAYILGSWEFYGIEFKVTPSVLVPRPETETLVARALELIGSRELRVVDIATGSGAIAVAIALNSQAKVTATDLSPRALQIAKENARGRPIEFREGDLLGPLLGLEFDLVCANPPYVSEADYPKLAPELHHEPRVALACGDGYYVLRKLAAGVKTILADGGRVLVEIGAGQAETVKQLFYDAGLANVVFHKDLAGIDRVAEAW